MIDDSRIELTKRLFDKSLSGALEWQLSDDKDTFLVTLGDFAVSISEHDDPEYPEAPDYWILIRNAQGLVIDSFGNASLRDISRNHFGQERNAYGAMKEIFVMARRTALGVDKAMARLLDLLK